MNKLFEANKLLRLVRMENSSTSFKVEFVF